MKEALNRLNFPLDSTSPTGGVEGVGFKAKQHVWDTKVYDGLLLGLFRSAYYVIRRKNREIC